MWPLQISELEEIITTYHKSSYLQTFGLRKKGGHGNFNEEDALDIAGVLTMRGKAMMPLTQKPAGRSSKKQEKFEDGSPEEYFYDYDEEVEGVNNVATAEP